MYWEKRSPSNSPAANIQSSAIITAVRLRITSVGRRSENHNSTAIAANVSGSSFESVFSEASCIAWLGAAIEFNTSMSLSKVWKASRTVRSEVSSLYAPCLSTDTVTKTERACQTPSFCEGAPNIPPARGSSINAPSTVCNTESGVFSSVRFCRASIPATAEPGELTAVLVSYNHSCTLCWAKRWTSSCKSSWRDSRESKFPSGLSTTAETPNGSGNSP